MNEQTQTTYQDTVAKDFFTSMFIVSMLVNITVAVSWMAFSLA